MFYEDDIKVLNEELLKQKESNKRQRQTSDHFEHQVDDLTKQARLLKKLLEQEQELSSELASKLDKVNNTHKMKIQEYERHCSDL